VFALYLQCIRTVCTLYSHWIQACSEHDRKRDHHYIALPVQLPKKYDLAHGEEELHGGEELREAAAVMEHGTEGALGKG
jgi:hypothetical protein